MLINRSDIARYVVFSEDSVLRALEKITANEERIVFCVSEHGLLQGAFTDGDFRRWLAGVDDIDLTRPVLDAANTSYTSASIDAAPTAIASLFTGPIDHVPLVDDRGRLVAVARNRSDEFYVGPLLVGGTARALLIAEIGINHNGSIDLAKQLVDAAVASDADCVKFQLRDLDALYRGSGATVGAGEDLGPQYTLDLLTRFSMPAGELVEVFDHCADVGIPVMCTPWDEPSVAVLEDYGIPAFKVASADLTNHRFIDRCSRSGRPMVLSTGMSNEAEILETSTLLRSLNVPFALLHCNSTYPAPFRDINLAYIRRLSEIGRCPVGYSGHERGHHVPVAAVAIGAQIIEKHFTLDRAMEGNDHKVSLLPDEFADMVRTIREVEEAMGGDQPREITVGEMMNRVNLAKSLVAGRDIKAGDVITPDAIDVRSPGRGLQPNRIDDLVGRVIRRPIASGDYFFAGDLEDQPITAGDHSFGRPWGLPVRYHDFRTLADQSNPDFLEFHLSYKDLEIDPSTVFDTPLSGGFAVHSPDLFQGDFILNLAEDDDDLWQRAIVELNDVLSLTRRMHRWFPDADAPVVIASVGGFSRQGPVDPGEIERMYERVAAGIAKLDTDGVRFTAQTLPPFPWYLGGQLFCNLFVDPRDTRAFADAYEVRLCFDASHSKLAATHLGLSFSDTAELLLPVSDHLHLVDAAGVDGEGLQVGEGEIDWPVLLEQLDRLSPSSGFIPEIWQGHVDNGSGFWLALDRLEELW